MTRGGPSRGSVGPAGAAAAQGAFALALFDELARGGVRDVVVCPGSRSTPLVVAAARTQGLELHVRLDERGAGFFAIGRSLASQRPVAIVVTSGTAAAELHAAVAEADLAGVPLVVLTADRPPELHDVGAPQTIDQTHLYGRAVRRFADPGPLRAAAASTWRPLAARLLTAALDDRGPVHCNVPLVEPLDAPPSSVPAGRADGAPWRTHASPTQHVVPPASFGAAPRGLLLAGRGAGDPDAIIAAAEALGWPLLADPLSGARAARRGVVAAADLLLRDEHVRARLRPEVVVQLGALPSSKALGAALGTWEAAHVLVTDGRAQDPLGTVREVIDCDPTAWCRSIAAAPVRVPDEDRRGFLDAWATADAAVQEVLDESLAAMSEPAIARRLSRNAGDATLLVSNSMPVRDLEWFGAPATTPPRVLANRGANGIDGVVSTALGAAMGSTVVAVLGDLAFLHDVGALADGIGREGTAVLVVLDNHGGGIFSFLPQRESLDRELFDRCFTTPPRVELDRVAQGFGVPTEVAKDLDALTDAVAAARAAGGVQVVVAAVPGHDENVAIHRSLVAAATTAARRALDA